MRASETRPSIVRSAEEDLFLLSCCGKEWRCVRAISQFNHSICSQLAASLYVHMQGASGIFVSNSNLVYWTNRLRIKLIARQRRTDRQSCYKKSLIYFFTPQCKYDNVQLKYSGKWHCLPGLTIVTSSFNRPYIRYVLARRRPMSLTRHLNIESIEIKYDTYRVVHFELEQVYGGPFAF